MSKQFQSLHNQFLIVRSNVALTNIIDPVITELDGWFEKFGVTAFVTSGLRDAQRQIGVIQKLAREHGVEKEFPEIRGATLDGQTMFAGRLVPVWAPAWSRLLNLGVIVNPPKPAATLFDYYRRDTSRLSDGQANGELKLYKPAGYTIGTSPHFNGTAFDIGLSRETGRNGQNKKIAEELEPLRAAFESGTVTGLKGYLVEHDNNCIHCDCLSVKSET